MRISEYILACSIVVNGLIINVILAKFEVNTAVLLKIEFFWNITLCRWTVFRRIRRDVVQGEWTS
jgi:hypothetical protein